MGLMALMALMALVVAMVIGLNPTYKRQSQAQGSHPMTTTNTLPVFLKVLEILLDGMTLTLAVTIPLLLIIRVHPHRQVVGATMLLTTHLLLVPTPLWTLKATLFLLAAK